MNTSLDHLPAHKQYELKVFVDLARQVMSPDLIILFGSFARGDWVEDEYQEGHITYSYQSDYDLLLINRDRKISKNITLLYQLERMVRDDGRIKTPTSILMDSLGFVNEKLDEARYFYADIRREGILLYDSGKAQLHPIGKPNKAKLKQMAKEDFEDWVGKTQVHLGVIQVCMEHTLAEIPRLQLNKAAFELHQAAESLFTAVQLVFTGYRPKSHDLEKLLGYSIKCEPSLIGIFPRETVEGERLFELLRKAYVDARYRRDYTITREELETLIGWIESLLMKTRQVCERHIGQM